MLPFATVAPMDVGQQVIVGAAAEERHRRGNDIKAFETEIDPLFQYNRFTNDGRDLFAFLYRPRFIYTRSFDRRFPDPNLVGAETINRTDPNDTPFSQLQQGGFVFQSRHARWRLALNQYAAYGTIPTQSLLIQAPWNGLEAPADPSPIVPSTIGARFTLVFSQSEAILPLRVSKRTALIPALRYDLFGGADRASRGVIARTNGPGASLALEHAATQEDRFISYVGAGLVDTTFQDDRDGVTIVRSEARQTWRHHWSDHLHTEVMGGGSLGGDSINGFAFFSLGHVSALWDSWKQLRFAPGEAPYANIAGPGRRLQLGVIAKVAPWIDLFSGDLEQRFVVSAAANYTVSRVTFRGSLSHARVFNTPQSVATYQIVLGEGSIRYQATPIVSLDAGMRIGYQDFDNAVRFSEITQVTGFVGLAVTPLPYRF